LKVNLKTTAEVNELIVRELLERRSELQAATANLYLRGTVLAALCASQVIALMNAGGCRGVRICLFALLSLAFVLGLSAFWPRKKPQYTIELLRDYLSDHGKISILGYQKYLSEDYDESRVLINKLNWCIVFGFCISGVCFIPMFLLTQGYLL
jgi:hypothetical protein